MGMLEVEAQAGVHLAFTSCLPGDYEKKHRLQDIVGDQVIDLEVVDWAHFPARVGSQY